MNSTWDFPVGWVVTIVFFLLLAALAAMVFRKIRFPYTVGLVVIGALLGILAPSIALLEPLQHARLTPHLILYVFLPTLLFEAALGLDVPRLKEVLVPVLMLAIVGLAIAAAITGLLVAMLPGLSLGAAMVFGVLISATDPVAVIALFKEVGAPRRLTMLVDGESLFNDATAIVGFQVLLGVLAGGSMGAAVWFGAGLKFLLVFAGGFGVGLVIGYLMTRLIRMAGRDPLIQIALTTVSAYVAFIAADYYLELSGVMSVVGAGIVISNHNARENSDTIREYLDHFWSYASFVANSFIFLLLGFSEARLLLAIGRPVLVAAVIGFVVVSVLAARAISVWGCAALLSLWPRGAGVDSAESKILFWGSLRGALPVGLVMTIPPEALGPNGVEDRQIILGLVLGVVLFSLLVQGTTLHRLLVRLRLSAPQVERQRD